MLGDPTGALDDSHAGGLLEYPHYTRPPEFRGWGVPEVLLSGDHARVDRWRREQALLRTWRRRPDLLERAELTEAERAWLRHFVQEQDALDYRSGCFFNESQYNRNRPTSKIWFEIQTSLEPFERGLSID